MSSLLALLKQKQQDMAASRKGRTAKLPDNNSRWRILGSWRGEGQQFWHDFGQHFIKDAAGAMQAIYVCTDKTFGRPCQVCDAIAQGIKGATDDATMKALGEAKSAARVLVNALHLDSGEPHKVHILELPPTVWEMILAIMVEWEEAGEPVIGPSGKDLIINRTGTGKNTKYSVQVAAKSTVVPPSVAANVHDLDNYVAQESLEQQTRALNSVRSVSGLLPPPAAAGGLPPAARAGMSLPAEDPYAAAPAPARRPAEFVDVPSRPVAAAAPAEEAPWAEPGTEPSGYESAAAPVAAARPAAPVAAPVAAAAGTGDSELDDLLAKLG